MAKEISRKDLHEMVDQLPSSALPIALECLSSLLAGEESLDTQTLAELDAARAETGETVSLEEARRRLNA